MQHGHNSLVGELRELPTVRLFATLTYLVVSQ